MKKILFTLFSLVFAIGLFAQQAPPQGINYQAMVYVPYGNQCAGVNSSGQLAANTKQVVVKFTITEGYNGPIKYEETITDTTDQYGLLSTVIGTGTPTSLSPGLFNQIDWSLGNPYLKVKITLTQYNSSVSSNQKLWSVPYALYADEANSADYATNSGYADSSDFADMAGNGITGVTDNGDGTLTFTYYDGSSYTTGVLSGLVGTAGPQGPAGQNGSNGQSAYDIWLSQGNIGTVQDFLNSITGPQGQSGANGINGQNGLSAYQLWLSLGNSGTVQDFLNSITGPQGSTGTQGPSGPAGQQGSIGSQGPSGSNGQSAYDIWLAQGNTGTQQDFLNSLQGATGSTGSGGFTHQIGEYFGGGVIFQLWKDSIGIEHGLIIDLVDLSNYYIWSTSNSVYAQPIATSEWDGLSNSNAIVSQHGVNGNSAAKLCLNSTNGGYNDWYLPSPYEFEALFNNYYLILKSLSQIPSATNLNDKMYWTSNDGPSGVAVRCLVSIPSQYSPSTKSLNYDVRAIRAF